MKKTELMELAQQATDSFIEAQKKLMDVAGKQINAQLKATGRTLEMIAPFAVNALPDLAREGIKTFVDTEKALIDTVTNGGTKTKAVGKADHRKHPGRTNGTEDRYCGSRPRLRRTAIGGVQLILSLNHGAISCTSLGVPAGLGSRCSYPILIGRLRLRERALVRAPVWRTHPASKEVDA